MFFSVWHFGGVLASGVLKCTVDRFPLHQRQKLRDDVVATILYREADESGTGAN